MAFHQLLRTNLEELITLSEEYPYVALYSIAAAKKARMQQDNRYDKLLSKAAIRVPSRTTLKQLMNEEIDLQDVALKTEVETEESHSTDTKLTHQEAKEKVSELRPATVSELQQATEVDEGEIVLNNPLTPKPVNHEELAHEEVVIDGQDQYIEVSEIHEAALDEEIQQTNEETIEENKLTHQEAKEKVSELRPATVSELQQATEVDEGEIVLNNPLTPKPVNHEELDHEEVVIDGQDQYIEVSEIHEAALDEETEEEEEEETLEEQSNEKQPVIAIEEENGIEPQEEPTEQVSFSGFGSGYSQFGSQLRDVEDFQFVPQSEVSTEQENPVDTEQISTTEDDTAHLDSLRTIQLPIEDDSVIEIGDELIEKLNEEEETGDIEVEIYEMDLTPVSSLNKGNEEESMYKKIVQLLNDELDDYNNEHHEPNVVDVDYGTVAQMQAEESIEIPTPQEAMKDALDDELESLYAQAAYEATFEQELIEQEQASIEEHDWRTPRVVEQQTKEEPTQEEILQEEVKSEEKEPPQPNQLADSSQTHSFSGWLSQLSNMGANFAQEQKEHQQRQTHKNPSIEESLPMAQQEKKIDQTKKIDPSMMMNKEPEPEERPELTTKQVQELARKSMLPSKAFYTETLAYVYELQEKWSRAIEVYEQLSLQNPKKSSYFASQIKLLKEKLK